MKVLHEVERELGRLRKLGRNEFIQRGDWINYPSGSGMALCEGLIGCQVNAYEIYRPQLSGWVSYAERKPTEADGLRLHAGDKPSVLVFFPDGSCGENRWDLDVSGYPSDMIYWMPLHAPIQKEQPIIIDVGGQPRKIIFNKDGSIQVGCATIPCDKVRSVFDKWNKKDK